MATFWLVVAIFSAFLMVMMPLAYLFAIRRKNYSYKTVLLAFGSLMVLYIINVWSQMGVDWYNPSFENTAWYEFFTLTAVRALGLIGAALTAACLLKAISVYRERRQAGR